MPDLSLAVRDRVKRALAAPFAARAFASSLWTIGGSASSQAVRLGMNLLLAKLLVPESFGVMLLVNTILQGIKMLSDLGIGPSVVQHPEGETPEFLRTAWTLQVVRSFGIALVAALLAWPFARIYEDRQLLWFVPVAGLQAVINGFNSATLFVLQRRLQLRTKVLVDLGGQLFAAAVMVTWAKLHATTWVLLGGAIAEALFILVVSHRLQPRFVHRFEIDRALARQVLRFGRWVFFATAFSFLASKTDRFVLGRAFPTKAELGVYSFAALWSAVVLDLTNDLSSRVLFPLYARWSGGERDALRQRVARTRLLLGALFVPALLVLSACGPWFLALIYDTRYRAAGPMLRVLAAGSIAACATATLDSSLLAVGDSFRFMLWQACRVTANLGCMYLGYRLDGANGVVHGIAWANVLVVPLLTLFVRRHRLVTPAVDLLFLGTAAGALLLAR